MTDMEKVINGLECCSQMEGDVCMKCPYANECDEEGLMAVSARLAADALSLLKEQEPIKPLITGHGDEGSWWYGCGNCGTPIDPDDKFCRKCGRAVEWDAID